MCRVRDREISQDTPLFGAVSNERVSQHEYAVVCSWLAQVLSFSYISMAAVVSSLGSVVASGPEFYILDFSTRCLSSFKFGADIQLFSS